MNLADKKRLYPDGYGIKRTVSKGSKNTIHITPIMPSKTVYAPQIRTEEKLLETSIHIVKKLIDSRIKDIDQVRTDPSSEWTETTIKRIIQEVTEGLSSRMGSISIGKNIVQDVSDTFSFDQPEISIDRSAGHQLRGDIGEKVTSVDNNLQNSLDALEKLQKERS